MMYGQEKEMEKEESGEERRRGGGGREGWGRASSVECKMGQILGGSQWWDGIPGKNNFIMVNHQLIMG